MSAQAGAIPSPPVSPRAADLGKGLVLSLCALGAALAVPYDAALGALMARAGESRAAAPGADAALLLSPLIEAAAGLSPPAALLSVSLCAIAFLLVLPFALSAKSRLRALAAMVFLLANPLTLQAILSGHGLAAAGLFLLFSQMLVLPQRPPHLGMAPLGAALFAGGLTVPGFSGFALPLFAVLFLIAPPAMAARHMVAVYLIAFLPFLAWEGALRYSGWLSGASGAGALPGPAMGEDPFLAGLSVGTLLCLACAPGLLIGKARKAGVPILLACGLASTAKGVPVSLAGLAAAMAQGAALHRFGGPLSAAAGLAGAGALAWLTAA